MCLRRIWILMWTSKRTGREALDDCFIDLFDSDAIGHGQVTYVGVVEAVGGMT